YDKKGPAINSIITLNSKALQEADRLDAAFKSSGFVGPLHGIPVLIKDQVDTAGMPTTLGSTVLKDYYPSNDAFVVAKLKKAGAIIMGKTTLGEFGGGDTYGSLFGATRNPYNLDRTAGGSSGGNAAALSSNFATLAVGEEISASIRRPSTWNSTVGMRPTLGLVSRTGMWDGWPSINGSLGPMARTVSDIARLLDVMVGYDPEDPLTAHGVGNNPDSYTKFLDRNGLKGARIGIIRESLGSSSEPDSEDFKKVAAVFDKAVQELKAAGAVVVDPVVIPNIKELLRKRASGQDSEEAVKWYFRDPKAPFHSREDIIKSEAYAKLPELSRRRLRNVPDQARYLEYLPARQELMINFLKVMADNQLDAIVHRSIEHQPTLISQGINPPYLSSKGAVTVATFLVFVSAIAVPAGFTTDNLPVGITFLGRPYSDGTMIKLAYSFEQATHHRKPPSSTPALPGKESAVR
ncbi:MAG: amidase, partial [Acidobacteria bacterium]|nr:amidase [Acidobacteriota bacterium]